ncbi:DUF4054 domain-containing protein [Virgibacillus sediminis]|uniref:DUF4054 domain-containing protein n=1 Tax=Virgibacillus sediminis TaxID=202260 RepID=A0ABV7A6H0_9BACI
MESLTTAARVKSIASHLKAVSNEDMDVYIEDASQEVSSSPIKEEYRERATRYLAAHMASLNVRQAQNQKVGEISQTFTTTGGAGIDSTPYGQEYDRILKKSKPLLNLTVI